MADLSAIKLPDNTSYSLKDATARASAQEINSKLYSTIAGVAINTTTGAMELWSVDLNNITATGFYNAMTCTNAKYQYSTLIVIGYYLTGYCLQIQQDVTTGAIATRSQINGTWSAWKNVDIARVQTQADYEETDTTSEAYIANKPTEVSSSDIDEIIASIDGGGIPSASGVSF